MNMKKNVIQTLISLTVIIGICSCTTSPKKTTQKEEATGKWVFRYGIRYLCTER